MTSVDSHTNIRAVHAMTPEVESENVMTLAPGFKLSALWMKQNLFQASTTMSYGTTYQLIRAQPQRLDEFRLFGRIRRFSGRC